MGTQCLQERNNKDGENGVNKSYYDENLVQQLKIDGRGIAVLWLRIISCCGLLYNSWDPFLYHEEPDSICSSKEFFGNLVQGYRAQYAVLSPIIEL